MTVRYRLRTEAGATAIEYALMITLIAIVIFSSVVALGFRVTDLFERPCDELVKVGQPC